MTVTVAEVKHICGMANALQDTLIQGVITMVSDLAVELFTTSGYSATMQNAIERYLVAHYLTIAYDQGGLARKRTGTSEEEYRTLSTEATGLALTIYGQQAQALDVKGALTSMSVKPTRAEFRVI